MTRLSIILSLGCTRDRGVLAKFMYTRRARHHDSGPKMPASSFGRTLLPMHQARMHLLSHVSRSKANVINDVLNETIHQPIEWVLIPGSF